MSRRPPARGREGTAEARALRRRAALKAVRDDAGANPFSSRSSALCGIEARWQNRPDEIQELRPIRKPGKFQNLGVRNGRPAARRARSQPALGSCRRRAVRHWIGTRNTPPSTPRSTQQCPSSRYLGSNRADRQARLAMQTRIFVAAMPSVASPQRTVPPECAATVTRPPSAAPPPAGSRRSAIAPIWFPSRCSRSERRTPPSRTRPPPSLGLPTV